MVATLGRLLLPLERVLHSAAGQDIAIEEHAERDMFVLLAELPGVDPARELSVTVYDGELKIEVERVDWHHRKGSEFRYGAFSRTVQLPRRAAEETLTATYERGVLRVSVRVRPQPPISRCVPILSH